MNHQSYRMRKVFAAIAVAMMSIFLVGCYKELAPDTSLVEKLAGKWVLDSKDNAPVLTNSKIAYNFVSASEAYLSASFDTKPEMGSLWFDLLKADVAIRGTQVILTYHPSENTTTMQELTVNAINASELSAYAVVTITTNGEVVFSEQGPVRLKRVDADYSTAILGLWEGQMVSSESEYDDGQEHRWLYKEDGTFTFYLKNEEGIWVEKNDAYADYIVAGDLLCTRWKNAGLGTKEGREWWEITALGENSMVWTALREKKDGTRYTAAYSMKKVSVPTKAEIEKALIGKWMTEKFNGEKALTNQKAVFTFLSRTQAAITASVDDKAAGLTGWICQHEYDYEVEGNTITLTSKVDEHTTYVEEMIVDYLDSESLRCQHKHTEIVDGASRPSPTIAVELKKQEKTPVKYSSYILGTWEGRAISDRSGNDDGKVHRWEYTGTSYVYYVMNGGNWVPSSNSTNEYFVDGRLLLTRWVDNGVEYREWWEIMALDDHTMVWTALRRDEYGDLYTASFSMTKVANLGE